MGEEQSDNDAGRAVERVTIAEAAALLGCHPNTVRSRVKAGMYRAEKVHTENGPTWMIERDSLTTNAPTNTSQQGISEVPAVQQEALQELARAIVREAGLQPDAEREARLEGSKLEAEAFKTQVLISSGLLVGLSAVVGILPEANMLWLLFLAFSFVLASVVFGVLQMRHIAREVADPEKAQQNWLLLFQPGRAPMSYLVAGLLVFLLYLSYNLPGGTRETLLSGTAHVVMAVSAVLLLLIFGAIARRILKWWTSRSS